MQILPGKVTLLNCFRFSSEKESTLKGSKFLLFRVYIFFRKGIGVQERKREVSLAKIAENLLRVSSCLKANGFSLDGVFH